MNLSTLAMLARKLGPSLGFFGWQTLFYFGFYSRLEAVILIPTF